MPACNLRKVTTDEAQFTAGENSNTWIIVNPKRVFCGDYIKKRGLGLFGAKN